MEYEKNTYLQNAIILHSKIPDYVGEETKIETKIDGYKYICDKSKCRVYDLKGDFNKANIKFNNNEAKLEINYNLLQRLFLILFITCFSICLSFVLLFIILAIGYFIEKLIIKIKNNK